MISECVFTTPLALSYLRNNRSTRQKSLRCFPSCSRKGHVIGGFCGVPLCVDIKLSKTTTQSENRKIEYDEYIFIAEIRPISSPRLVYVLLLYCMFIYCHVLEFQVKLLLRKML